MDETKKDRAIFIFSDARGTSVLMPESGESPIAIDGASDRFDGLERGRVCAQEVEGDIWALAPDGWTPPPGTKFADRRGLFASHGEEIFLRAGAAFQMMFSARRSVFCGVCGGKMADHERERARWCPSCGNLVFPSMFPAVIVGVERGGELLLGHNAAFAAKRYSVLAGFVEPGESAEAAIHREIWEEARVRVRNIRYFGSQPWPFPNSLMLGFFAEWESGDPTPGDGELTDVRWFAHDELPELPPKVSIARRLIDDWIGRSRGKR